MRIWHFKLRIIRRYAAYLGHCSRFKGVIYIETSRSYTTSQVQYREGFYYRGIPVWADKTYDKECFIISILRTLFCFHSFNPLYQPGDEPPAQDSQRIPANTLYRNKHSQNGPFCDSSAWVYQGRFVHIHHNAWATNCHGNL